MARAWCEIYPIIDKDLLAGEEKAGHSALLTNQRTFHHWRTGSTCWRATPDVVICDM